MTIQPGDIIICRGTRGYAFTEGKEYTVLSYEPADAPDWGNGFQFPAYVEVTDDWGRKVHCHASRFIPKETP